MPADWFDPNRSRRFDASLRLEADRRTLRAECADGRSLNAPVGEVTVSSRLGGSAQSLLFPNGTVLIVRDNDALEQMLSVSGEHLGSRIQHKIEHSYRHLFLLACVAVALTAAIVLKGIPGLAEYVAWKLPPTILDKPANALLEHLEHKVLHPSKLEETRQRKMQAMFAELAADLPWEQDYRLLLRHMAFSREDEGIPNAFAFPNGVVLVTDSLVELAVSDDEIIGVLVHEIEHLRQRHTIQSLISSSILALAAGLITGDITGFITLPVFLAELRNVRQHELEADCLAFDYMRKTGRDIGAIGSLLERMEAEFMNRPDNPDEANTEPEGADGGSQAEQRDQIIESAMNIMSSHPLTYDRKDPARLCADYDFGNNP